MSKRQPRRQTVPDEIDRYLFSLIRKKIILEFGFRGANTCAEIVKYFKGLTIARKRSFWTEIDEELKEKFPDYRFAQNWASKRFFNISQAIYVSPPPALKERIREEIEIAQFSNLGDLNRFLKRIEKENGDVSPEKIESYGHQRYNEWRQEQSESPQTPELFEEDWHDSVLQICMEPLEYERSVSDHYEVKTTPKLPLASPCQEPAAALDEEVENQIKYTNMNVGPIIHDTAATAVSETMSHSTTYQENNVVHTQNNNYAPVVDMHSGNSYLPAVPCATQRQTANAGGPKQNNTRNGDTMEFVVRLSEILREQEEFEE